MAGERLQLTTSRYGGQRIPLELHFHANLRLERIEDIARRAESKLRRRRLIDVDAAPDGVHVPDVRPVEEIEQVHTHVDMRALARHELPRESKIDTRVTRSFIRIAADRPGPIGVWVAVGIGVTADEQVVVPPARSEEHTSE